MLRNPTLQPVAHGSDAMTSQPGPLICVVIPCYNEEGNIGPLYERIVAASNLLDDLTAVRTALCRCTRQAIEL